LKSQNGAISRIQNGPLLKIATFTLNGTSDSEGHFGAKKVNFVPGTFRILEMAPFSDFQGLIS